MRRLLFSILSLGMVAIVAFGVTRAYFTDQEVLGTNTIETAKVDVDIIGDSITVIPMDDYFHGSWHKVGGFLPGMETEPFQIAVYNRGHGQSTVPVKYAWTTVHTGGSADLFNVLNLKVTDGNCDWVTSWPAGIELRYNGPLSGFTKWRTFPGDLGVNITRCTWFTFSMPTWVGNGYQGLTTSFDFVLDATQVDNPGWNELGTI